jgi:class 3 adenylate cyclase
MICPACGEENDARFRLCGFCGAALPKAVAAEERKVVTLVFADVTGSTALGEQIDPESVRWVMSSFFEIAREVLERHGGTVEKFIGDAVMAAFGIPRVHEDDALRGVRAAAELRGRLRELSREVEARYSTGLGVRIGVNTGEVVAGDAEAGQAFASGDTVNIAARLEQAAAPGEVLLGEATLRLVRDAVTVEEVEPLTLKGKAQPVAAWRLTDVASSAAGIERRLDTPLIGRARELASLLQSWQHTVDERDTQVVTVVAAAGTGKTRLLSELADHARPGGQVLIGRCLAYGEGITFWPVAEAVRAAASVEEDDSLEQVRAKFGAVLDGEEGAQEILDRLAPALGLPGPNVALEETFWAIRKLLERLARSRPLLVVLDDVHWAEDTLLDLIEYLAGWTRGVPLLLVCAARPDLFDRRTAVVSPRANTSTLLLEPLGMEAAGELMAWQLGTAPLAPDLAERILRTSEGNPLFVQELVRMLIDDGLIVRRNGRWEAAAEVRELSMPATIQALLTARLDQLEAGEREVAQRAAVVGHVFSWGAVRELCAEPARHDLGSRLHMLVRKRLIVPEASTLAAEDAFRFGHVLVRDAAYAGLAKRTRAELHERYATWLEGARHDRVTEHEEILGYHLEQAASYRRDLGDAADAGRLAAEASARLVAGGRRALASGDLPAAGNLLGRAGDILPREEPQRLAIRLESIPALWETGRAEETDAAVDELMAAPVDSRLLLAAQAWRAYLRGQQGRGSVLDCRVAAEAWLSASEAAGDHAGQATALGFIAKMDFWLGSAAAADDVWERAVEQATLAGDPREQAESLVWSLISGMFGPVPVEAALERCEAIASREGASRKVRAVAEIERGVLAAMQGDVAGGRERVVRGRAELDELGLAVLANVAAQEAAIVEQMANDPLRAEMVLRPTIERLRQMGEESFAMTAAAMLSRALDAQGRFAEAAHFAELCTPLVDDDTTGMVHAVQALAAAADGDHDTAIRSAELAVERIAAGDFLRDRADRFVDLACVHARAGRPDQALAALGMADTLYVQKGCFAALARTTSLRAALAESA